MHIREAEILSFLLLIISLFFCYYYLRACVGSPKRQDIDEHAKATHSVPQIAQYNQDPHEFRDRSSQVKYVIHDRSRLFVSVWYLFGLTLTITLFIQFTAEIRLIRIFDIMQVSEVWNKVTSADSIGYFIASRVVVKVLQSSHISSIILSFSVLAQSRRARQL